MRLTPWTLRRRADIADLEQRSDYTTAVVDLLRSGVTGDTITSAKTAAEEIAAGLWSRAFASARVTPDTPTTRALTPDVLAHIGRCLCSDGEAVFEIVVNGAVDLVAASSWTITGDTSWVYELTLPRPSETVVKTVEADRVVHLRYAVSASEPWKGIGPLEWAKDTDTLLARIEKKLGQEFSGTVGYVIPVPEPTAELQQDVNNLKGATTLAPSTAGDFDLDTPASAPRSDWDPKRLGPHPPETIGLRDTVSRSILAACGVPASLLGSSDGTLARESFRQFLHGTISPVARIVAVELGRKLDVPELAFDFSELFASDLSGRARAFGSLVNGGMDPAQAAALSGLLVQDE